MAVVERHATPLTLAQMLPYVERFYSETFKRRPTVQAAAWLLTLLSNENRGGAAIQNHNWGNLAAFDTWKGDRWKGPTTEPEYFRAYPTHEAGARAWWELLNTKTHRRIIDAANANDSRAFFNAVTTPHPETGRQYCYGCGPELFASYRRTHDQILQSGILRSLPIRSGGSTGGGGFLALLLILAVPAVPLLLMKGKRR